MRHIVERRLRIADWAQARRCFPVFDLPFKRAGAIPGAGQLRADPGQSDDLKETSAATVEMIREARGQVGCKPDIMPGVFVRTGEVEKINSAVHAASPLSVEIEADAVGVSKVMRVQMRRLASLYSDRATRMNWTGTPARAGAYNLPISRSWRKPVACRILEMSIAAGAPGPAHICLQRIAESGQLQPSA